MERDNGNAMLEISVPPRGVLHLGYLVLDLNGTMLGGGGLALACLTAADIVVPDIGAALDLLLRPRRVLATLRR